MKMSLRGSRKNVDPAAEASKKGRIPTLGEVQKSLKVVHGYDHLFKVYAYGFLFQQLDVISPRTTLCDLQTLLHGQDTGGLRTSTFPSRGREERQVFLHYTWNEGSS